MAPVARPAARDATEDCAQCGRPKDEHVAVRSALPSFVSEAPLVLICPRSVYEPER